MTKISKKPLFNPDGDDSNLAKRIIKGNSTNLFNLNEVKYQWAKPMYRLLLSNFWIPEKVNLSADSSQYSQLTKDERDVFENIISFLTFLDSVQTNNLPNIKDYITAPEVSSLLSIQEFQETIHSQSYAYILESVIPQHRRNSVYEKWRDNEMLLNRNKYIASIYSDFINEPNDFNLARSIVANYILESIYFYNGFLFFYNLVYKRKIMSGVSDEIRYINRDELTHVHLFRNIITEINRENEGFISEDLVHSLFFIGVEEEIAWINSLFANREIEGMSVSDCEIYTKYLADKRIVELGFKPLYNVDVNPYKHLEMLADLNGDVKGNFFESTISAYNMHTALDGWDEI